MTPGEEHKLYETDRAAWAKHVAPNWVRIMEAASPDERQRMWGIAGKELRAEIRRLREGRDGKVAVR